jgi:hypothetical protein
MSHINYNFPLAETRDLAARRLIVLHTAASHPLSFPDPRIAFALRAAEDANDDHAVAAYADTELDL